MSGAGAASVSGGPPASALGAQIVRNSLWSLASRGVYVLGWVLIAPYMLLRLGEDRFGLWSLLTVFSGLVFSFDLGVGSALTKFVAEHRTGGNATVLRSVVTVGGAMLAAIGIIVALAGFALRDSIVGAFRIDPGLRAEARMAVPVAAAVYALLNAQTFVASLLAGIQRMDVWNGIAALTTIGQLAAVAAVLTLGGGLREIFLVTGASLVAGAWLGWVRLRRLAPEVGFERRALTRPGVLRSLIGYSAALQIINLGVLVQFHLDKLLFAGMLSLAAVAHYELGWRVMSALWSIPALLLPPLLPAASELAAQGDRDRIVRLYHRASRYVLPVGFAIASGMLALSPALYTLWLGPGHEGPIAAARALALMMGVNVLTGVGTAIARGIGQPWLEVRYQLLAMVSHVILSLILIPRWGFEGGLAGMVLSTSFASLVFVALFHGYLRDSSARFVSRILSRPLLAAACGGLAAWLVSQAITTPLPARLDAALRLGTGLIVVSGVTASVLLATRYFEPGELHGIARLVFRQRQTGSRSGTA